MGGLKAVQVLFVHSDGLLKLFDVLGSSFAESGLGLAVPLLPLLRRGVDLPRVSEPSRPCQCEAKTRGVGMARSWSGTAARACRRQAREQPTATVREPVGEVLTGLRPPLRLGCWFSWVVLLAGPVSPSGLEPTDSSLSSLTGFLLSMDILSAMSSEGGAGDVCRKGRQAPQSPRPVGKAW